MSNYHEPAALAEWLNALSSAFCRFSGEACNPDFDASLHLLHTHALKIATIEAANIALCRGSAEIISAPSDDCVFIFQCAGESRVKQGRTDLLKRGDIMLIDAASPCRFDFTETARQCWLIAPRSLIGKALHFSDIRSGHRIAAASASASIAHALLAELVGKTSLTPFESESILDAMIALLRPEITAFRLKEGIHDRAFRKAVSYIEDNIRDEHLSPDTIASKIGISVRGLYRIFAERELNVARHIRNRRLDMCAEALRQKANEQSLAEIGFKWGFTDPSHFSNAFKLRFGIAPSEYRKTCSADTIRTS